uniref:PAP-associated domain-containing protein n=1 Tax=Caenorhabditis tropicalis TaxID=1561998 RepID=A0A1I7UZ64_9PELO
MSAATVTIPMAPATKGLRIDRPAMIKIVPRTIKSQCGVEMAVWKDRKLTSEIESLSSEAHRAKLRQAASDFEALIKAVYPDAEITMTGSFAAGVDLPTSDLDFSLSIPSLQGDTVDKLLSMRRRLQHRRHFSEHWVTRGMVPVLYMMHSGTRIDIDVTIDNEPPKRNTKLLIDSGLLDSRFQTLCRAVKTWASKSGVENSREGRLNSFSVCLLLIHYLQQVGVLPADLAGTQWRSANQDSLGALFYGFMRYFSRFDFRTKRISVRLGKALEKDPLASLIVVEDPYLNPEFNCARTVRQFDIFERILEEFREAERSIRETHRLGISDYRNRIEEEGKERDWQILEWEWSATPETFWEEEKLVGRKRAWPKVVRADGSEVRN